MLKVPRIADERLGCAALRAFAGPGAARVLAGDAEAVVLERLAGSPNLNDGDDDPATDDVATRAICGVVAALHAVEADAPMDTPTLQDRFRALREQSGAHPTLAAAAKVAAELLAGQGPPRLLHGDMHRDNVLWSAARQRWVAIDPQPVWGERTYDYANLLKNPMKRPAVMLAPGRLRRTAALIATEVGLPLDRLLGWGQAHAALSAAWALEDGEDPKLQLAVSALAAAERAAV